MVTKLYPRFIMESHRVANASILKASARTHSMEVLFDHNLQATKRRKSSMVTTSHSSMSSCFVHDMLDAQRLNNLNHAQKLRDSGSQSVDGFIDERSIEEGASRILTKNQLS